MAFDFKKEYKELYRLSTTPSIIEVPTMNFLAVRGKGDPNQEDGEYGKAVELLYGVAYTLKMSYKGPHRIDGFFEYVAPPLEGLWWQDGAQGVDYAHKQDFGWISLNRLPDFIQRSDVEWAIGEATRKKKLDYSPVEFLTYDEGLCVQCMHVGDYDDEPATIQAMDAFAQEQGYADGITADRYHHEIYLSDPFKCDPAKLKTVIRHPVTRQ